MSRTVVVLIVLAIVFLLAANAVIWGTLLRSRGQQAQQATTTRTPPAVTTRQSTAAPQATGTPTPRAARTATPTAARTVSTSTTRLATSTPAPRAPSPTATTARPQPTSTPALLTNLDDVLRAVEAGRSGARFRLVFSEQEIQNEVSAFLSAGGDLTFSDIRVALQPGVAVITGKARVLAFNVGFTARTSVVVNNGRVRLKVTGLDLLGGLVPGVVKDRLIAMIEESADLPLLADLPVKIERVDIELGQAIATGVLL